MLIVVSYQPKFVIMTLFQKDFNVDKLIANGQTPYDDIPKHKLRQLLMSRDKEIKKLKSQPDPDWDKTAIQERNTWLKEKVKELQEEITTLKKHERLFKMAQKKLKKLNIEIDTIKEENKELQTSRCGTCCRRQREMKEEWSTATHKIATENSELHNEIKKLKTARIDASTEHRRRDQSAFNAYMKQKNDLEKLQKENRDLNKQLIASRKVTAVHIKRVNELTDVDKQIDKVCSRIQTPDNLGHLMPS